MLKEAIVINLIGGPGCGKSICCSEVFAALKRKSITCEISHEYIKRKLYEEAKKVVQNQIYIFGKQQFQLFSLKDSVEVIVTDSPILLSTIYDNTQCPHLKALTIKEFNKYDNMIYFIERDDKIPYETAGRYQDKQGAKKVDDKVQIFLDENNIPYKVLKGIGKDSLETIINDIEKLLQH
jgi:nicotinamide riboside kinase